MSMKNNIRMALRFLRLFFYRVFWRKWYLPKVPEITVDELYNRLNANDSTIILDLRDKKDFEGRGQDKYDRDGHIRDAKRISIMELSSMYDDLPRDGEIVTICPGGGMSLVGAELLNKAGFVNAKSLKGGIWAWAEKGYPLVKGKGPIESHTEKIESEETDYKQLSETIPSNQYSGKIDLVVDARNLFCPEPILKSRKAMRGLKEGQVLEILTTDPGSQKDIPAWTRANENELLVSEKLDPKGFRFLVRKTN